MLKRDNGNIGVIKFQARFTATASGCLFRIFGRPEAGLLEGNVTGHAYT